MTSAHGCGVRAIRGPARSGFASGGATVTATAPGSFRLDLVPAELVTERRCDLHRVAVGLPRGEAREQRVGEGRHRDVVGDRLEDGPPSFARIRDVTLDVLEVAAFGLEGALGELEEPRPDDAALVPDLRDLLEIE